MELSRASWQRLTRTREVPALQDNALTWEDFRLVKAVADARGMPGAAALLGLSLSTIFRRLGQIEAALGTTLFERRRAGYAPTPAGEEMVAVANGMDEQASGFARKVAGREILPAGEVRIATADALFVHLLAPLCARFQATCPDIRLDIAVGNPPLNLSKRDADIAIRATDTPPENLVGRRAARLGWALYGRAADFPDSTRLPDSEALTTRRWVGLDDSAMPIPVAKFTRARVAEANLVLRANTVLGLAEAIGAGIGLGYLPCFVGDVRPSLLRLGAPDERFAADLWLLTHPDLRHSPRIRILLDFLAAELSRLRPLLEGNGRRP